MEGRKEAFRMYLEQTGTLDALQKVLIQLYELKDKRPDNEEDALKFMFDNLSNDFPTQADYDKLLKEVEESRKEVERIKIAKEEAQAQAEVQKQLRKMKKSGKIVPPAQTQTAAPEAGTSAKVEEEVVLGIVEIKTIEEAKKRLDELKKNPNCKSLLVQCLSVDKFESTTEADLLLCIRRGLEDPNILVGIYAAAEEDYSKFKEIFDPIITKYFGLADLKSIVESNWKNGTDDSPLNFRSHLVLRTSIMSARSIEKFRFLPKMTDDELTKLKADVEAELKLLTEDSVKGRYHDFAGADETLKDKLDKQLLFESENPQLKAAGVTKFTAGRATFCNNDQNLAVWVNEEEHLKFIATGTDGVKETFIRLRTVVENCEFMTFKTDQAKHTITFCPTFFGPAIHVSAVVKLASVAARKKIDETAKTLQINVAPTKVVDEFEVTNKPKLSLTEFGAVQEFIVQLKQLFEATKIDTMDDVLARLEELTKSKSSSLLTKHLTEDLCATVTDDDAKKVLINCIRLGLEDENAAVGICAADRSAYKTFAALFQPIIKEHYDLNDIGKLAESKWDGNDDDLNLNSHFVLRSRITCGKSVGSFPFVPAMTQEKLSELKKSVQNSLNLDAFKSSFPGTFCDLDKLNDPIVRTELEKRHLLFESETERLRAAGATVLSEGRAIFYSTNKDLVIWVNEEEHLKFIATGANQTGNSTHIIKDTYTRLRSAVTNCGQTFEKSDDTTDPKNCLLTFCPTYLGPAIHLSTVVKFPNVAARAQVQDKMKKNSKICVKPTKVADEFEITNKPSLNKTEFNAVKDFVAEVSAFLQDAQIKTVDDAKKRFKELQSSTHGPKSLLATVIAENVFEAALDATKDDPTILLNCIRLGLEDERSPVGICAVNEGAYTAFAKIFEPIIESYYGLSDFKSLVESNWTGTDTELELNSKLILRSRITCAKSVNNYDFVAVLDKTKLEDLKTAVGTILENDTAANGTLNEFPLKDDVKVELEKRRLSFEPENARLKAAGATDLSNGRAIWCCKVDSSDDYRVVVWVNEEEHLKFIASRTNDTQNSVDVIKETFISLRTVVKSLEGLPLKAKPTGTTNIDGLFQYTFCPTFLAPAIHVSVTVKLPKIALRGNVKELAAKFNICVQPTEVADEFEVTNKPSLEMNEFDAVKDFVGKLTKFLEEEGKVITAIDDALTNWQAIKTGPAPPDSLLIKCATDAKIFDGVKNNQTTSKMTLLDCIRPGLEDETLPVGIYAVDEDAYEKFGVIFKPIVAELHGTDSQPDDDSWKGDASKFEHSKFKSCAKFSEIACRRSFKGFPFIPAMSATQLRQLRAKVKAILEEYDDKGTFYDLCAVDDATKSKLKKSEHWFDPVNERLRSVGVKDFVTGRAVFVNKDKNLAVWLCEEDHLKFVATAQDGDIAKAFTVLSDVVTKFDQKEFARHATWGWKTFCPTNLGSTIEAVIVLELPEATAAIADQTKAAITDFDAYCTSKSVGRDVVNVCEKKTSSGTFQYEISNAKKFGTEYNLIKGLYDEVVKLTEAENP